MVDFIPIVRLPVDRLSLAVNNGPVLVKGQTDKLGIITNSLPDSLDRDLGDEHGVRLLVIGKRKSDH